GQTVHLAGRTTGCQQWMAFNRRRTVNSFQATPLCVVGFPTRDDLQRSAYIPRNRKRLTQELINTSIAGRDCARELPSTVR
ncbi:MAG TPA: hypothetical protein VFY12_00960, partial [Arenimonas sp.]|nr:hypothetical protein [Arenimonas sp.]